MPPRIARLLRARAAELKTSPEALIVQAVSVALVPGRHGRRRLLELDLTELWSNESGGKGDGRAPGCEAAEEAPGRSPHLPVPCDLPCHTRE